MDVDQPVPLPQAGHEIGIDLGIKDFAVTSDGDRIANPRHRERKARNPALCQRRLARCKKGSANRRKAKTGRRPCSTYGHLLPELDLSTRAWTQSRCRFASSPTES